MTSRSKIVLAASIVASCSSSLDPKCANRPLLLIPTAAARRASDRPSSPSTVASRAASRRIAARLRSPSDRCRRTGREAPRWSEGATTLDKLARPVVLSSLERPIVLTNGKAPNDHMQGDLHMSDRTVQLGAVGKLGRWTAGHFRIVAAVWVVVALSLGALAPRAENALSGAGWEATGSESVQARGLIDRNFNGFGTYGQAVVVHAPDKTLSDPAFERVLRRVESRLRSNPAVARVVPPQAGVSVSADRHLAVI